MAPNGISRGRDRTARMALELRRGRCCRCRALEIVAADAGLLRFAFRRIALVALPSAPGATHATASIHAVLLCLIGTYAAIGLTRPQSLHRRSLGGRWARLGSRAIGRVNAAGQALGRDAQLASDSLNRVQTCCLPLLLNAADGLGSQRDSPRRGRAASCLLRDDTAAVQGGGN